ncbi:MAG: 4Fe-4S binding protein [Phycisphaerae bacterium]|nr:4Fe-4S binding protein [Phycisphaerae bacterium]
MTIRNIVKINEDKCNGCGKCVTACAEGAIKIIEGKAKLVSETYCDGLGACLGHCPQDAITIEKRESAEFDEQAVKKHLAQQHKPEIPAFVCPGMMAQQFDNAGQAGDETMVSSASQLRQWPVQLKLVSPNAAYFKDADLLLVADCVPFAMADFHSRLLKEHTIIVGCPKLDDNQLYLNKLTDLLKNNNIKRLTVAHMEVPCCTGLVIIAQRAIEQSGCKLDLNDVTVTIKGKIIN